jgi:hypothetical protein
MFEWLLTQKGDENNAYTTNNFYGAPFNAAEDPEVPR